MILAVKRSMSMTHKIKVKFKPKWQGPLVIETVYSNGAYRLFNQNDNRMFMPINNKFMKKILHIIVWLHRRHNGQEEKLSNSSTTYHARTESI